MRVPVVPYSASWPAAFGSVAAQLRSALAGIPIVGVEHVGSTAVPGLAAKPIIDIDIVVRRDQVAAVTERLAVAGYVHQGDLGLTDREAFAAPDDTPRRHVYVCVEGSQHLRNHLLVRDALRRDELLRRRYDEVKTALALRPDMTIEQYIAGKSGILQQILATTGFDPAEL